MGDLILCALGSGKMIVIESLYILYSVDHVLIFFCLIFEIIEANHRHKLEAITFYNLFIILLNYILRDWVWTYTF
jgi:hypothetical protein